MIEAVDRVLGRVTMYRLVLLCLAALGVVGAVLLGTGAAGTLSAPPGLGGPLLGVAVLASAAVLVGWSLVANLFFATVFRVRAHHESAIISGLILLFLISPTLDPLYLCVDALAATLAMASKYLIAPRGRHLLNPAAFGAFAVYSLGLQTTTWWVGLPGMLPAVAVLGALVLVRTRHVAVVTVFIATAVAAQLLAGVATGTGPLDSLALVLLSSPVVFLGCFMLTEPLTLPPRRWQQLLVAVVVALLLVVPNLIASLFGTSPSISGPQLGILHLQLTSAPELALLLGNVLAFALAGRRGILLEYRARRQLTPTSWEFEFAPSRSVAFRAGQYLELTLPHRRADGRGTRRTFSIASPPPVAEDSRAATVRVGLRLPDGRRSTFKSALLELEPGGTVAANSVAGDFLLPRDPTTPVLLVAGGIGITPFIAQLGHAIAAKAPRDTVLVYAISSIDELAYAAELQRSGARVLVVAPEPLIRMPEHWTWIGAGPLTPEMLLTAVPDARARTTYLSGPPSLIAALRPALRRAGIRRIRTDAFLGY